MSAAWILNLTGSFEPSLSLRFADLMNSISLFLNLGTDHLALITADNDIVDGHVQSGVRRFYSERDWSFLEPVATLTTVSGTGDYDAPDDFGGTIYGDMTFAANSGRYHAVVLIGEGQIVKKRQDSTSTSRPRFCAVRYKSSDGTSGQRHQIMLDPIPDAVYVLTYVYPALQNKLTSSKPYPLGGMVHSETIKEACLASAESGTDDEIGLHEGLYQRALSRSIERDNDIRTPGTLGFNRDGHNGLLRSTRTQVGRYNGTLSTVT